MRIDKTKTTYTHEELEGIMKKNNGYLNLYNTQIKSLPDNLTVGGNLCGCYGYNKGNLIKLNNGDYVEGKYLYADGILTHIKRKKTLLKGKYTYYIGKIPGRNVLFDGKYYVHCSNIKEGILDIEFKEAKDRGSDQFRHLTTSDTISKDEAITMYRIITGACQQGTMTFVNSLKELKEEYTIQEIIDMTEGKYGHKTFKEFFINN